MSTLASVQSGKTEYKSITVADNATAEEFMDFYLDDASRPAWVQLFHACICLAHVLTAVLLCHFSHCMRTPYDCIYGLLAIDHPEGR